MIYQDLAQFRANTREAFNTADTGEEVIVFRYGVPYILQKQTTAEGFLPPIAGKIARKIEEDTLRAALKPKEILCKMHGLPVQDGRKICLMKGCK